MIASRVVTACHYRCWRHLPIKPVDGLRRPPKDYSRWIDIDRAGGGLDWAEQDFRAVLLAQQRTYGWPQAIPDAPKKDTAIPQPLLLFALNNSLKGLACFDPNFRPAESKWYRQFRTPVASSRIMQSYADYATSYSAIAAVDGG